MRFNDIYFVAGLVAVLGLIAPLATKHLLRDYNNQADSSGRRSLSGQFTKPVFILCIIWLSAIVVLIWFCGWSHRINDWLILISLSAGVGFGLAQYDFNVSLRKKITIQLIMAFIPPLLGFRLSVPYYNSIFIDALVTVLLILGLLNALSIMNFIDGFSALIIFLIAACFAVVFEAAIMFPNSAFYIVLTNTDAGSSSSGGWQMPADSVGVILALALCGASLAFFIFRKPSASTYMGDFGAVLLGYTLALLFIRMLNSLDDATPNPVVFLPLVLILPLLFASLHRDRMSLIRRQRLSIILIVTGHLPLWIPVGKHIYTSITSSNAIAPVPDDPIFMAYAAIAVLSTIIWAAGVTHGRAIRGWTMRVLAEPIADILRVAVIVSFFVFATIAYLQIELFEISYVIYSLMLTAILLIIQVTWWRNRVDSTGVIPRVVIFGNRLDYAKALQVFRKCEDLFGRRSIYRSQVDLASKHLRSTVSDHLSEGDTVLILNNIAKNKLIGIRSLGDLVFASDALLLRHINHKHTNKYWLQFLELFQNISHRLIALLIFIIFLPVFLLLMVLVKLSDPGPVFFSHTRVGRNEKPFTIYKFRSMRTDAPKYGESPINGTDSRLTKIGKILRKLSLDELPQLINVIRGDMRLVGPRPEMPFICNAYNEHERQRLEITPGITGLWQISPYRNAPIHDHVEYDLAYRKAQGPILDTAIMISTIISGIKSGC